MKHVSALCLIPSCIAALALQGLPALASASFSLSLPALHHRFVQLAAATEPEVRFPVAHAHMGSWCMGYLYISAGGLRYEVIRPDKDKNHGFRISRSDLTAVQQWMFLGTLEEATEIKTARAVYHFWLMPNENDLQPGQPSLFNPRDAADPGTLMTALRDPSSVLGNAQTASSLAAIQPSAAGLPQASSPAQTPSPLKNPGASQSSGSSPFASVANSDVSGTWAARSGQSSFNLILNADRSGSLNGLDLNWQLSAGKLSLATAKGTFNYRAALSGESLTLSGGDLKQPLVFHRVKQNEPTGLFSSGADSDGELPVPGTPPLTKETVDKATQFFEWLLDAQLTVGQRAQFRDSLVRSWKTRQKDDIDATLNVLKFQDQLSGKTPEEQRLVREVLREKYLDLMRQTPNDDLSRWVLNIYDSAHRAIADGNPPLTMQVADAYAEFVAFMVTECLHKEAFVPDRHFKDQLAQSLAEKYSSYSAEQQKQFSQVPLLWEALRFRWARLSERERETFRREWKPAAESLLTGPPEAADETTASANPTKATDETATSANPSRSVQDYFAHYNERLFVNNMCNSSFATTMSLHLSMWR